jgi:glutamate dehydrogenase
MPGRFDQTKADLLRDLPELARRRLGRSDADVERFVRRFYADVPSGDLATENPEDLLGAALAMWEFGRERPPGGPKIRLYEPASDRDGWRSSHTVVELVNDDMPFLVDSIVAELQRGEAQVLLVVHPVLRVRRDPDGRLISLEDEKAVPAEGSHSESYMQIRVAEQPASSHPAIAESLAAVLADVRSAVADWAPMRRRCQEAADELRSESRAPQEEVAEVAELLDWMVQDRFTFLGYRELELGEEGGGAAVRTLANGGLGLLRDPAVAVFEVDDEEGRPAPELIDLIREPQLLRIAKAHRRSTVHRAVHLDTVAVKRFTPDGEVSGERLFVGLFTQEAYSQSPRYIPVLRRKVTSVLQRSELAPGSHDARALLHILESYPRDELFQAAADDLFEISRAILDLQDRQRIALFTRRDPFGRFYSSIVYLPRDIYDTRMRKRFQAILQEAYGGEVDRFYIHLSDSTLARIHFIVRAARPVAEVPAPEEIEARLVEAARSWEDRLSEELVEELGEVLGKRLARRYAISFPPGYQTHYDEKMAVVDCARMEEVVETGELALHLYRPAGAEPHEAKLKLYLIGRPRLSDVVPMLERMGLRVIDERPNEIHPVDLQGTFWIRDFALVSDDGLPIDLGNIREAFHETFHLVWRGEVENDGFNKLVMRAGLVSREVTVLRAYAAYLRQARIPFSQRYMQATLAKNPEISRSLVDLFLALFDPEGGGERKAPTEVVRRIESLLDRVENLDEDRILRRFLNAIEATLRTNFFQVDGEGRPRPYLAFKLDSLALDNLPRPRPFREVWIYSTRVEAIHLRGGKVARGGVRWSDRREDFRTEVLGLMKAQMVKNAVIVPVGSKGGFVVKSPPAGSREELIREVEECYRMMIRGLLDVTDNQRGHEIVPPPRVVRRDDDDPYLVVAADKGTASFSDLANALSAEYGFWLDDAFASGGSAGYDHKGMGITAKGAWESVKRHFREIGVDIQQEPFTVVGVGDMSGDVFGNGMLLSPHIRLVGAFNHQHVFIDPDPDPEKSFTERRRLFEMPRSTWDDYDRGLISAGGGVFARSAKRVDVTPEMVRLLGLTDEKVTPNDLIRALLAGPVDLLWFGGIGTYVRASTESDTDVDDRANDAVRIDATELKARVIGEGANLGLTQLARIEYGMGSGRLNTDFIDNSAGVDTSDHEVNIKILLRGAEEAGELSREDRNRLLAEMTEAVAELVLRDNYLQTQAISVTHYLGAHLLDRMARFMRTLQKKRRLDRRIEGLPDDEDLAERMSRRIGFARSELAVLLSYAKIDLYEDLLDSDLPDDASMNGDLERYFPAPLRERYGERIAGHRLRREIIATVVTNEIINRAGIAFAHEVIERTGMPAPQVARAFVVSREVFDLPSVWRDVEALDSRVPASLQASMLVECGRLIERETVWFVGSGESLDDIEKRIEAYREGVRLLESELYRLVTEGDRKLLEERVRELTEAQVPDPLARRVASFALLAPACDIVRLARESGAAVTSVGEIFFAIGARFGFDWLRRAAGRLPADSAWDKLAINAIVDDLVANQTELTRRVLAVAEEGQPGGTAIERWAEDRRPLVLRTEQLVVELQSASNPSLAMLAVANRQLKGMRA